ncbi:unnamed protein product [Auanema sp. JU1783]|nr:unnamed protein product [Auanema sp. JU1783]
MSRPGAWSRVLSNLGKYLRKDWSQKTYVGEDGLGHRFYEIANSRQNVARGYEHVDGKSNTEPSIEWQSWLRGTRKFPPSEQELFINAAKQQAQLMDNSLTEKNAPSVHSEGKNSGDSPSAFPKYKDLEIAPGYNSKTKK